MNLKNLYPSNRLLKNANKSYSSISENLNYNFSKNYCLSIYAIDAIYSFIPKNACSSIRFSVAVANGFLSDLNDIDWIHNNNTTFISTAREICRAKYTFVILRCPFRRLISTFFNKFVDKDFQLNDETGKPLDISFSDFVYEINSQNKESMNEHWRPQSDFLHYEVYDDYFCLENFTYAINRLSEKGLNVIDTRKYLKHDKSGFSTIVSDFSSTPISKLQKLKKNNNVPKEEKFYTKETYKIVSKIYEEDIELYIQKFGDKNILKV
jgi:hypothetical protein